MTADKLWRSKICNKELNMSIFSTYLGDAIRFPSYIKATNRILASTYRLSGLCTTSDDASLVLAEMVKKEERAVSMQTWQAR